MNRFSRSFTSTSLETEGRNYEIIFTIFFFSSMKSTRSNLRITLFLQLQATWCKNRSYISRVRIYKGVFLNANIITKFIKVDLMRRTLKFHNIWNLILFNVEISLSPSLWSVITSKRRSRSLLQQIKLIELARSFSAKWPVWQKATPRWKNWKSYHRISRR